MSHDILENENETGTAVSHASSVPAQSQQSNQVSTVVERMVSAIMEAATNPEVNVEKMERMFALQERMMDRQAEMNFNQDFIRLQSELPVIKKNGQIVIKDKLQSSFAKYEDIDAVIRPLLKQHGFGLTFNSKQVGEKIVVFGSLIHKDGHAKHDEIPLTIEASGSKNTVQGVGSTISYGKRYLVTMLLNLVFEGEDDDGTASGKTPIPSESAAELKDMLRAKGATTGQVQLIARLCGVDTIDEIPMTHFFKAKNAISVLPTKELKL